MKRRGDTPLKHQLHLPLFPFTTLGSFFSFAIPKTSKHKSLIEVEIWSNNSKQFFYQYEEEKDERNNTN